MSDKKPADTLRDGALKATIWENDSENGSFHNTVLAKTYEDKEGNLRDSHSFGTNDLLRVSELARGAYSRIGELKREASQEQTQGQQTDQDHKPEQAPSSDRQKPAPEQSARAEPAKEEASREERRAEFKEQRQEQSQDRGAQQPER